MGFLDARLADLSAIRWLRGIWEGVARVIGSAQDDELELLKFAASADVPTFCPDDALGLLARSLRIPLFGNEDAARLRARLLAAFPTWEEAGLPQAIIRSLEAYTGATVRVFHYAEWPTPDQWFSKFYVVLTGSIPWVKQVWDGFEWGGKTTWGSNLAVGEVRQLLGQVIFWKSPQSLPVRLCIDFGEGMVWGLHAWDEELWGGDTICFDLCNLWGEVKWDSFKWGTGKWITGEISPAYGI